MRRECPVCRRPILVNKDGELRWHYTLGIRCPGSEPILAARATRTAPRDEVLRLIAETANVYVLVLLVEGTDAEQLPIAAEEAEDLVRRLEPDDRVYVIHDAEDGSLYLGLDEVR